VVDRALAFLKSERWPDMAAMRGAWQEAHPHWLATLPPPRFTADPEYIDASALEDAARTSKRSLFDPRELLNDSVPKLPHPGAIPVRSPSPSPGPAAGPGPKGTQPTYASTPPSRLPHVLIAIAGALFVAFVIASVLR
jgi:hypothetical protein